jgi:hypothetical protein
LGRHHSPTPYIILLAEVVADLNQHRAAYPVGKSVQVFYDPNEPATAVLEPANPQGTFVQLVFSFVFGAGGLLMFWVFSKLGEGG